MAVEATKDPAGPAVNPATAEPAKDVQVARRSADGSDGLTWHKEFVVAGDGYDDPDHDMHAANVARTAEEALQRGLHPKTVPALHSAESFESGRRGRMSTRLTYAVDVEPARTDTHAEDTVTPSQIVKGGK